MLSDNIRGAGIMVLSMASFTINDACIKAAARDLPLWQAVTLRGAATVLALVVIAHVTGALRFRVPRRDAGIVGLRSLTELAATVTFLVALMNMPLANLSAILQSVPLAVTLGAALFFGEKVGWRRMMAIAVGFAGVLIIIRPGTDGFDIWSLMALSSVAFVVLRDLTTRRLSAAVPSVTVAMAAAVSVTILALVLSIGTPWESVDLRAAGFILAAAGFLIVGYMSSVRVMRIGDVGFVSPFRYTSLLWAVVLGWSFFGEFPDSWTLIGAALVVGSGVFALLRERALRRRPAPPGPPPS